MRFDATATPALLTTSGQTGTIWRPTGSVVMLDGLRRGAELAELCRDLVVLRRRNGGWNQGSGRAHVLSRSGCIQPTSRIPSIPDLAVQRMAELNSSDLVAHAWRLKPADLRE